MNLDRKATQDLFIRICKDSGFQLDAFRVAALVGAVLGCTPFMVYLTMGINLSTMNEIAAGTHPAALKA